MVAFLLFAPAVAAAAGRQLQASKCPTGGVRVDHVCWQLSEPGESCRDLCGGAVDRPLTINGASDSRVVHALDDFYGLGASYFDDLDEPCHTSWLDNVRPLPLAPRHNSNAHTPHHCFFSFARRSPATT